MLITISLVIAFALVIWFKTDAIYEYGVLFNLNQKYQWLNDYHTLKKDNEITEPLLLNKFISEQYHQYFIVRLLSCPICSAFWLSLVFVVFFGFEAFASGFLSLLWYFLFDKLSTNA